MPNRPYPICARANCDRGANLHEASEPHAGMETDCPGFQWKNPEDPGYNYSQAEFEGGGGTFGGGGASGGW